MNGLELKRIDGAVVFTAKVVPGSSRTAICGLLGGMLKMKVSAAPEKGRANRCVVDYLTKRLGLKKNDVRIVSGQTRAIKDIRISGLSAEQLLAKLGLKNE